MSGKLPKQWKPYVEKLEQRINELEAIENGLDDRITVLEDYITELEVKLDAVKAQHVLEKSIIISCPACTRELYKATGNQE